jgi:hypothetical protein
MSALAAKLAVVQIGVKAVGGQRGIVGAALDDAALLNHDHLVGVADGAQPGGDGKARAALTTARS